MNDTKTTESHAHRLLSAMREYRRDYMSGKINFQTWVRARRMIMSEAEMLGVTDKILANMSRS
jgi:hypothetical protein